MKFCLIEGMITNSEDKDNATGRYADATPTTASNWNDNNVTSFQGFTNWTSIGEGILITGSPSDNDNRKETSLKYAVLAAIVVTLGLNCGLFLWKGIKRRRDPAHAVLVGNLVASHMFTGIYLLLPFLDSTLREAGITHRTPRRLCEIISFLQMLSCEASGGSLLVIAMDRVYSFRHPLTVTGMTPMISRMICTLVWLASVMAAGIYVILVIVNPYTYDPYSSLSEVFLCWRDSTIVVEYFLAIAVWLNLALFSAICVLYVIGAVLKCRMSDEDMVETFQSAKEKVFFLKTFFVTLASLLLWMLLPIAGWRILHIKIHVLRDIYDLDTGILRA